MNWLNVDEFKKLLLTQPLQEIVQKHLFQGEPYVFRGHPQAYILLRQHLHETLNLQEQNVTIIGSAKVGFSVSPDNFGRPFSDGSDIDVLVVDAGLFDAVWGAILQWHYPRRNRLEGADWIWARGRRNDIYWGWLVPDRIRLRGLARPRALSKLRDISTRWFTAFRGLSRYQEFAARDVNGRLYRTWNHAALYHVNGLEMIRSGLLKGGANK